MGLADTTLKNGEPVKTLVCKTEGASVRPVKGLKGCAHLDPQAEIPLAPLWMPIIKRLADDYNLGSLNYDWRKWGDRKLAEEVLDLFRDDIEKLVADGGSPVSIVAHSMGAQVTLWCLTQLGEDWEKKNVKQLIFCAPAVSGTPVIFPCFANGPAGNMISGGMVTMPLEVADQDLARITATFACMMAEMPTDTGGASVWPKDHIFATTPSKEYNIDNVDEFLADCAACGKDDKHWQVAPALWPAFKKMVTSIRAPKVKTSMIYSKSEDTVSKVKYNSSNLLEAPDMEKVEGGDTTITAASIEALAEEWLLTTEVKLHATPEDQHVTHSGCINCPFVMQLLPRILECK